MELRTTGQPEAIDPMVGYYSTLVLALAAPAIAELLSGSCPPLLFFVPWIFGLFVLFYGGSAVLIREFTVRWNTGWKGVLLLGAAFGILQEGLATRAFFDPHWRSLGPMVDHGRFLGVNWIWSADAILYHAVLSTALPILLVYHLFPTTRTRPWLGRRGLYVAGVLFSSAAAVFLDSGKTRYAAPRPLMVAAAMMIVALVMLARTLPAVGSKGPSASSIPPGRFAVLASSAVLGLVLQIYALPLVVASAWITAICLVAGVLIVGWLFLRWSKGGLTPLQECALLSGAFGFFALMGFFQEVNPARTDNPAGMSIVGSCTLILLYVMWKRAARAPVAIFRHELAIAGSGVGVSTIAFAYSPHAVAVEPSLALEPDVDASGIVRVPIGQRLVEIVFATVALTLGTPIMIALAVVIRRGTPGPALFFQERLGVNKRPFTFVKFRTLYADARQLFPALYAYQYSDKELRSLKFKITNDPRVTPQGRWMRTSTLDELPNFWNVLRGDMALVGPRPEIPEMLQYYHGDMLQKFRVRPGITGLAQVSGRGRLGFHETVALDVEYVNTRSWLLDLRILILTARKILTRDGAF